MAYRLHKKLDFSSNTTTLRYDFYGIWWSSKMGSGTKPILKALVVADHVYKDVTTGKVIVCGIFHNIHLRSTPIQANEPISLEKVQAGFNLGSAFAYVSVTDADGDHSFNIRYANLATDEVHFDMQLSTSCKDPLETIDLIIPLPVLPQQKGVYALELLWRSNDPMGSFRITVGEL